MKKSETRPEVSEHDFLLEKMRKVVEKHEKSSEYQQMLEERILSSKDSYLNLIKSICIIWNAEIKSIKISDFNKIQQKELRNFKRRWKESYNELIRRDRDIKLTTNRFLENIGKTLQSNWEKNQLSNNMGFIFEGDYGIIEKPYDCQIPTEYQDDLFDLIHSFTLFSITLSEITNLCLEMKHFFNLESEATRQLEEYVKKLKRNRKERENYKPLTQLLCADYLQKAAKKTADKKISYMIMTKQKHLIPKNRYLPDIKSFERKIQRWDASIEGKNTSKPPPFYSRYKSSAEFIMWADIYEQERYKTWVARKEKLRNRRF